ncbi:desmocollin-3-like [Gastrophryne carolinensis]
MGSPGGTSFARRFCCCQALLLLLLLPLVLAGKSCHRIQLRVPKEIRKGLLVGTVNLHNCLHPDDDVVRTSNPDLVVLHDHSGYAIYATRHITMAHRTLPFEIILQNQKSKKESSILVLLKTAKEVGKTRHARELLKRTKRRWRPMPVNCFENYRGTYPLFLQTLQSDTQVTYDIIYSISGQGVDQPPIGLFTIDPKTGDLYIHGPVDRETTPSFALMVYAKTKEGFAPEFPLDLTIQVQDDNDNAPVFTENVFCAEVLEHSKSGTIVGRVNATDRDEPNSLHTRLKYYLIRQIPPSPVMFAVQPEYGIVTTTSNLLDKETLDHYTLILEVRDMDGRIGSLSSTGTMSITVLDINDHAPVFTKQSYQTEVNENESGLLILRIPITDRDSANTSNWRAVYTITQGNEKRFFNITTDPKTNEGLLYVIKGINYEEDKRFQLTVGVANEVSLITQSGTKSSSLSTVPVTVIVKDVDEGPECQPQIKEVNVQENQTVGSLITTLQAIDPETKGSSGIRYTILSDPLSWVTVAENGRITNAKMLDYEAKEVQNHKYNITVLTTDQSGKTGTCTLLINLLDVDEHRPSLSVREITICRIGRTYQSVQAIDEDATEQKFPYTFRIDDSKDPRIQTQWRITQESDNTVRIEDIGNNPVGEYVLPISVADHKGHASTENLRITKCECPDSINCAGVRSGGSTALGGLAILIMVLSALLLAAVFCLLLACLCGAAASKGKMGYTDDTGEQHLFINNTEAPGVDVMDKNFKVPVQLIQRNTSGNAPSSYGQGGHGGQDINNVEENQMIQTNTIREHLVKGGGGGANQVLTGYGGGGGGGGRHQRFDASRHTYSEWQSFMNTHLGDKLYMCGQDEEQQHGEDYILPYNYEGKGSAAGSVGCCSELRGEDDRMDFLNHLEPKFRTLAEVCAKK